jgi:DNA-binding transcriptional regulator YdaS (Cro superfamily)
MAATKVLDAELKAYLEAGHSQAAAARHFGVSEPAIHQRLKRMRQLTSRLVALERANDVVDDKLSATARLERVQRVIDEELGWAVQEARREGGDRAALADVILKLAGEVRQQLGLQLAISRTLVDLRVVKEFHETVVEAIREESPETARRILARLKERRALRPSVELPTLTGGADAPVG